jgi:hypothetical protein
MAHLTHADHFNVTPDALNDLVRDPRRTPEYWVGFSGPNRLFGDGGPGTKAEYTLETLGAISGWLTCHHQPREDGVDTTTEFEYRLPGGVLGRVFDNLVVEKRVRRDFEDSLENLKLLAEASAAKPVAKAA